MRAFFARFVTMAGAAADPRIERAFAAVPREPFAGPGPWQIRVAGIYLSTPDDDPAYLYHDWLVALDAARGINIGEPALHARNLAALALASGETVLHIGAGAGYYTAILAELVGERGRVEAFEIDPALAARARANLRDIPGITLHERSGAAGPLPAADAIYVNASATHPSPEWLAALRVGGRLLFPLHPTGGFGGMLIVTRPSTGSAWPARFVSPAGFIAAAGMQDAATGERLRTAFAGTRWQDVRSLRLGGDPDPSCWVDGGTWWLSTEPAQPG